LRNWPRNKLSEMADEQHPDSEEDLEETRVALAPTLAATAEILPWLAKPRPPRFSPDINGRWQSACKRLVDAWSDRHGAGGQDVRPAIFSLYAIALETADTDCLKLGEALASAADRLEESSAPPKLAAALTATMECLNDAGGLEHDAFPERARHFAVRLESCMAAASDGKERSAVLDQIFVDEANEQIELMREALAVLPPDAYALKSEASQMAQQAELIELWGIMHLARQLVSKIDCYAPNLDDETARQEVEQALAQLELAIAAVDA